MVDMSPELVTIVMFGLATVGILIGFPLVFVLGTVAMLVGTLALGASGAWSLFYARIWDMMSNYVFLAVPMFVFMGMMVEKSGAADRLYAGLHLAFGPFRGGLAIATILMGTILAACVGVIAASVIMIALIATPSMLQRGYNKELVCGCVCAGGTLGILIPPSLMLVVYGPMAEISVGKLFMGAFGPGFLLSGLYMVYVAIRAWLRPEDAPPMPLEERQVSMTHRLHVLVTGMLPPLFLMFSVLGAIFFGIAAATEAAAVGALAAVALTFFYRRLTWPVMRDCMLETMRITSMALVIGWSAQMFVGVFLRLGGGEVIQDVLLAMPGGKWGTFFAVQFIIFALGFLIDWIGIVFIMVPLVSPLAPVLGFDPLWFAMMIVVNLQMSFMTPPMAYAIFYLKGIAKPEWNIDTGHIIRGVTPFVGIIVIALILCILFPDIILWLPHQMIKF
ncbi:MAG: TRAP transporter large permease subunit [Dehalococcoidia bacterium]|nr:TRAP transporter large permease subunit [Dehalococcoidia bacterium]